MSRYAVLGNPIQHSKSPQIHTLFAEQTKQELSYTAILLEETEFDGFVQNFFSEGGGGLNVTLPFKGMAFDLATSCSPRAELAKAVNTLFVDGEGNICGDNTDGIGLVTDIEVNHGVAIKDKRILILGAGGAVRGVLASLVFQQASAITVVNRTLSKAESIATEFQSLSAIEALSFDALQQAADAGRNFDIIINGTSTGLKGGMPELDRKLPAPDCCCYDLMYAAQDTPFVSWAKQSGARKSLDGLGMLVEQAAESFALWRGVRPETAAVMTALRGHS